MSQMLQLQIAIEFRILVSLSMLMDTGAAADQQIAIPEEEDATTVASEELSLPESPEALLEEPLQGNGLKISER